MAEIQFEHVVKQFPRQASPAVNDLSFTVNDGELLILLGPSGCGKTTALRMIAGLEEPDSGDIRIDGQSVVGMAPKDRDIALVFQQYALYPHLSARDNLRYPLKIQKISKQERQHRIDQTAELLKIGHLLDRKPASALGWRAATGGARTGDRAPAACLPDGRATLESRRQAADPHAHRDQDAATANSVRPWPSSPMIRRKR